jgi:pilus assembly protein Flp/PilA
MMNFMLKLRSMARKDEGQDILEYALLVALIAIGAVVAITAAGTSVQAAFNNIAATIAAAV